MIQIEAVDLFPGDLYLDSRNKDHEVVECVGNIDNCLPGGIAFKMKTGDNIFTEVFSRVERVNVYRRVK